MRKPSLNHVYRLVWNDATGAYVPVAEIASARRKRNASAGAVLSAALLLSGPALAADLPTGGQVVAGSGSISQTGAALTVNQQSGKLAVDWQSFSIGKGNSVTFKQPGRDSVALNRVLGPDVSVIQGALNANGQVFLVNPNGVVFTPTAQVNVGGIVASTLNISTQDFLAGNYRFEGASGNAIINQGNITAAPGGSVALIAAKISNTGTVTADKGNVLLGAGSRVKLDLGGPVKIEVEQGAIDALIEQGGAIRADGGVVYLTAKAAGDLASTVINHTGITQARTLATGENGKIVLLGDMVNDRIAVGGTLDASAPNGGRGGFVETSAAKVSVAAGALITTKAVSGQHGAWLIDPTDFTVSAGAGGNSDSGIGADTLAGNLENGSVELRTVATGAGAGNINVNAAVKWGANTKLTLSAHGDIAINAPITATGAQAGLVLNHGGYQQNGVAAAGSDYSVSAPVTLSGAGATLQINGQDYTLIHTLQDAAQHLGATNNGFYALAQDLDLSGNVFTSAVVPYFNSTLAGMGHTISNLSIVGNSDNAGLFKTVGVDGLIRDVALTRVTVTGGSETGMLAGINMGTLRNTSATGNVTGDSFLGGLVGHNAGTIVNSYASGFVTSSTNGFALGGLVGSNGPTGFLTNVYATVDVSGANSDTGGLVGINQGSIKNAYASGNVTAGGPLRLAVGGLVGTAQAGSSISNAYASGRVIGSVMTGGLVGMVSGSSTITNSQWDLLTTGQNLAVGGGGGMSQTNVSSVNGSYAHTAYDKLGTWSLVAGTSDVWVAKDAAGKAQWIMIEGQTRPFLASEYSTGIGNDHQLQLMAYDRTGHYFLTRDFNAAPRGMWADGGFMPVGDVDNQFSGSLDGQGRTITGLVINRGGQAQVGVFGVIGAAGAVKDVGLMDTTIQGGSAVGALAGTNYGALSGVYAINNYLVANTTLGGLVGYNRGSIINAYTTGALFASNNPTPVGGLVGINNAGATIRYTYSNSTITVTGAPSAQMGGLVGLNISGGVIGNSFWNAEAFAGAGLNTTGAQGQTLAALKQLSTFVNDGWDIDNVGGTGKAWRMYDGYDTPLLRVYLKPVTVSLADKVYDGQAGGGGYQSSVNNAQLDGALTFTTNSKNAGQYSQADGTLTVTGNLYSGQRGYDISYGDGLAMTISKKGLTADYSVASKVYDGTDNAGVQVSNLDGLIGSDTVSVSVTGKFQDKNAGNGKQVSISGIGLSGDDAGNYFITNSSATAQADIARASIVGNITADGKIYDGTTTATTTGTLYGAVSGDALTFTTSGSFADQNAGQSKDVNVKGKLTGDDARNYDITLNATTTANIDRRAISVAADDKSKGVGEVDPALTWRLVQGNLIGEDALQGSLSRAPGETAGRYVIGANGLNNSNYLITALDGMFTINGPRTPDSWTPPPNPGVPATPGDTVMPTPPANGPAAASDERRNSAVTAAQWMQASITSVNANPPALSGDLAFVPVTSGESGTNTPGAGAGQGARSVQGPAQVLVIDGGIRLPDGVIQGGI